MQPVGTTCLLPPGGQDVISAKSHEVSPRWLRCSQQQNKTESGSFQHCKTLGTKSHKQEDFKGTEAGLGVFLWQYLPIHISLFFLLRSSTLLSVLLYFKKVHFIERGFSGSWLMWEAADVWHVPFPLPLQEKVSCVSSQRLVSLT